MDDVAYDCFRFCLERISEVSIRVQMTNQTKGVLFIIKNKSNIETDSSQLVPSLAYREFCLPGLSTLLSYTWWRK
jgi:hypothetical protein